jgi:hypothetical protein
MTFSKPYLSDKEYLEVYNKQTFEEGDPRGLTEYSEFQKPYTEEEDWPEWEWTWPEMPFPSTIDLIDVPDPVPNPCQEEDGNCGGAAILGPNVIDCPDLVLYTQAHAYVGCTVAPWWAAFGSWEIDTNGLDPELVYIASQSPISCTVKVEEQAGTDTVRLKYSAADCDTFIDISIDCQCCDIFTVTGNDTTNPGPPGDTRTYTATVSPACPNATPTLSSNSGCEAEFTDLAIDGDGATVTVEISENACGGFKITVTDAGEDCESRVASKSVRINNTGQGGGWVSQGEHGAAQGCGGGSCNSTGCGEGLSQSTYDDDIYIRYGQGVTCDAGPLQSCSGKGGAGPPCDDCLTPTATNFPPKWQQTVPCPNDPVDTNSSGCSCTCLRLSAWDYCYWECASC